MPSRSRTLSTAAGVAVIFGVLTIISGGRALFGGADMGAVVPYVLLFNFFAGFAYVMAGIGLWRDTSWAPALSLVIALATAAVFGVFLWHVLTGGSYEMRTLGAMTLRLAVWAGIATVALRGRRAK